MTHAGPSEEPGEPYRAFAEVYADHWEDFAGVILRWFPELRRRFRIDGARALDLACGTGAFAIGLARAGWIVTGVDRSEDMLAIARRRTADNGLAVRWERRDMRELAVTEPVDLVTCWFDSLNYLLEPDDVRRTFRAVRDALHPGGTLLFDVNTIGALRDHQIVPTTIQVDTPDCFLVTDSAWEAERQTSRLAVHGFVRRDGQFLRFREEHVQRAYPLDDLEKWLAGAGFAEIRAFCRPTFEQAREEDFRAFFRARRPG